MGSASGPWLVSWICTLYGGPLFVPFNSVGHTRGGKIMVSLVCCFLFWSGCDENLVSLLSHSPEFKSHKYCPLPLPLLFYNLSAVYQTTFVVRLQSGRLLVCSPFTFASATSHSVECLPSRHSASKNSTLIHRFQILISTQLLRAWATPSSLRTIQHPPKHRFIS